MNKLSLPTMVHTLGLVEHLLCAGPHVYRRLVCMTLLHPQIHRASEDVHRLKCIGVGSVGRVRWGP